MIKNLSNNGNKRIIRKENVKCKNISGNEIAPLKD